MRVLSTSCSAARLPACPATVVGLTAVAEPLVCARRVGHARLPAGLRPPSRLPDRPATSAEPLARTRSVPWGIGGDCAARAVPGPAVGENGDMFKPPRHPTRVRGNRSPATSAPSATSATSAPSAANAANATSAPSAPSATSAPSAANAASATSARAFPSLCARFARGVRALDGRARGLLIATTVALAVLSVLIFLFSAEGGDASSARSDAIARALASLFAPDIDTWDPLARKALFDDLRFLVRKAAHATEYAVLAALWFAELQQLARTLAGASHMRGPARTAVCAFALAVVYACTDEIHQLFVGGRAGQAADVLIDAAGALVGVALALLCAKLLASRRSRKPRRSE